MSRGTLDLLVRFRDRVPGDEFVLLELNDDIGPRMDAALYVETLCLDELYVDLTLWRGRV